MFETMWRNPSKGWALIGISLILTVWITASFSLADEPTRGDDRAPRAGEVIPIHDLLGRIRKDFHGSVLEVELEQEWRRGGRIWVYEAKLLTPKGHVLKLEYDAKSLELLEVRGRGGGPWGAGDEE